MQTLRVLFKICMELDPADLLTDTPFRTWMLRESSGKLFLTEGLGQVAVFGSLSVFEARARCLATQR